MDKLTKEQRSRCMVSAHSMKATKVVFTTIKHAQSL